MSRLGPARSRMPRITHEVLDQVVCQRIFLVSSATVISRRTWSRNTQMA